ncbi:MAG: HalOD1 output domain-containing protein [Halobacteriota archaeon]
MSGQTTVLHVDDDPSFLDLSKEFFGLRDDSYRVLTATGGTEGRAILDSNSVDCVVSDSVRMPDGESFVSEVRRSNPRLPVVLFSGHPWEEVEKEADLTSSMTEYVHKGPEDSFRTLVHRVEELTGPTGKSNESLSKASIDSSPDSNANLLDDSWTFVGRYQHDSHQELDTAIIRSIEAVSGLDAESFEPLFETVDTDALAAVIAPSPGGQSRPIQVRIVYEAHELALTGDGVIAVRPVEQD